MQGLKDGRNMYNTSLHHSEVGKQSDELVSEWMSKLTQQMAAVAMLGKDERYENYVGRPG